jgi:drug/metabolite transporter (DMT)-like permease
MTHQFDRQDVCPALEYNPALMTAYRGEICSLLAALNWAFALVLLKRSGERIEPVALNLFKNTIAILLLAATLIATGQGLDDLRHFPLADIAILVISGFLGITLADTLLLHSLNRIGVGILSVVDCCYSPFVMLMSAVLLSEDLGPNHYIGGGLILSGVLVSTRHEPPAGRTRGQLVLGIGLGVLSIAVLALGIVMAKPVLAGFPIFWAATIRLSTGTVCLAAVAAASPKRKEIFSVFRPARVWRVSVPASILGTYISLVLWLAGFKYTKASIAAILNQTSVVFAVVLATLVLKESFSRRKLLAVGLAFVGALVVLGAFDGVFSRLG